MRFSKQQEFLRQEYEDQSCKPQIIKLGNKEIIVPHSYDGDINKFMDDVFRNDERRRQYSKHSLRSKSIDIEFEVVDKANNNKTTKNIKKAIIPYLKYELRQMLKKYDLDYPSNDCRTKKRIIRNAIRLYRSTIRKTMEASKYYPDHKFKIKMNEKYRKEIENLIRKHHLKTIGNDLIKTFKWSAKQTIDILAGATGAIPAVAYNLLKKKYKFPKNRVTKFIENNAIPYILKSALNKIVKPVGIVALASTITLGADAIWNDGKLFEKTKKHLPKRQKSNETDYGRSYQITDRESFQALYDAAFPLLIQSMMPTEIYVSKPYSDNGKTTNTAGLGSYWFPENGNPKSSKWIKTSEYVKKHKNLQVSGSEACDLADGWFRYREDGRIFEQMYKRLKGCELNICEFTAIASCIYNSETLGFELCDFVKENYKSPKKCANKLLSLKPKGSKFANGIKKRHIHEALLYLNINRYADYLPYLLVKGYGSSVNQLSITDCDLMIEELKKGRLTEAEQVATKIMGWRCEGAKTIATIMTENKMDIALTFDTEQYERYIKLENLYAEALGSYKEKHYEEAVKGFKKFIKEGGEAAEIHNDLAISYYHLGDYDKCIKESKIALSSGEEKQHPPAYFNMGLAYEAMHDYVKAIDCYKHASNLRSSEKVYKNALNRVITEQQKTVQRNIRPGGR